MAHAPTGTAPLAVNSDPAEVLDGAASELVAKSSLPTDGLWLEDLTVRVAPLVSEWDVSGCWHWRGWPHREKVLPDAPGEDVGIDAVAQRRSDGAWIAIQVKSRQLDSAGSGDPVASGELNKFLAAASDKAVWAERWLVVNGAVALGGYSPAKAAMSGASVKVVNVAAAVESQRAVLGEDGVETTPFLPDDGDDSAITPPPVSLGYAAGGR
ncbi:MAG: hypothetical protein OXF04_12675 [bacterium]|nr:hypothetical protein [bacterium]